jgi:cytochrome P450
MPAPIGGVPPISSDPPFHGMARRLLLPPFAPKQIEPWEDEVRTLCRRLLDDMGEIVPGETVVDAAVQYAQHIPVNVIGRMLGFPSEDEELFREFVHNTLERINDDPKDRAAAFEKLDTYINAQVQDHADRPRDDLTTYLLNVEIEGNKLSHDHVTGSIVLLLIAGIDTTWSAIGSSLWHLAQRPDDCQRLLDDPEVMTFALEEFLRAYAPVTMGRLVAEDVDFHGCPMKKDDWVLLPFPAANRDPQEFQDADTFIIDRQANRHAAFGLGIHRCLGSNLARLELKVAIEEFIRRFPRFELSRETRWSRGMIRGPRELPVRILETA